MFTALPPFAIIKNYLLGFEVYDCKAKWKWGMIEIISASSSTSPIFHKRASLIIFSASFLNKLKKIDQKNSLYGT